MSHNGPGDTAGSDPRRVSLRGTAGLGGTGCPHACCDASRPPGGTHTPPPLSWRPWVGRERPSRFKCEESRGKTQGALCLCPLVEFKAQTKQLEHVSLARIWNHGWWELISEQALREIVHLLNPKAHESYHPEIPILKFQQNCSPGDRQKHTSQGA